MQSFIPISKVSGPIDPRITNESWWNYNGISPTKRGEFESNAGTYFYSSMTGEKIPNFHRLKRDGVLLPHTNFTKMQISGKCEGVYDVESSDPTWATERWYAYNWVRDEYIIESTDLITLADDYMTDIYVHQAAGQAYSKGMDVLTFIGEFRETRNMFVNLVKDLGKVMRYDPRYLSRDLKRIHSNYKRGKYSLYGKRALKYRTNPAVSKYLEGRYGWRPLLGEIQNFNEALDVLEDKRQRISERAGASFTDVSTTFSNPSDFSAEGVTTYDYLISDEINVSQRGSISADFTPSAFKFNPIVSGWELIPYSFVLDWFIQVGNALEAMSFLAMSNKWYASQGVRVEIDRTLTINNPTYAATYSGPFWMNGTCSASYEIREPINSVSITPQTRIKLDDFKVIDSISLIAQRVL